MIVSMIPHLVKSKDLSLAELARRAGLTNRTVVKLYYADFTSIHVNVLDKLCKALDASPGDLLVYVPGDESNRPAVLGEQDTQPYNVHPLNKRFWRTTVVHPSELPITKSAIEME